MTILLAVSGGIDSMYMANKAPELFPGASFAIAHCNFALREEADADEAFVRDWAESRCIPFHSTKFDTAAYSAEHGISIEMAARELRYGWFFKLLGECGYEAVAVAHNANDNAETMMLNLLRGTGIRGMRGILPDTGKVLRPLLTITRDEITRWMKENGQSWREDCTNSENIYRRNRIRNEIFPVFREINPSFLNALNTDLKHFRQVDEIAEDYLRQSGLDRDRIDIGALLNFRHWKYLLFRLTEGRLNASELESLTDAIGRGGAISGKRFGTLTVSGGYIVPMMRIDEGDVCVVVEGPGAYRFKGKSVRIESLPRGDVPELAQPSGILVADESALGFPFLLRGWENGDWMNPLGLRGRKKLSDLFVDLKWGLPEKKAAIVAVSPGLDSSGNGHVAALLCERIDDTIKVTRNTSKIIRIICTTL